ncbi:MAG: DEAD/DEAH box helicase [Candidatus Paceibacterota bacterium]|jgi:DNA repair protein RadD
MAILRDYQNEAVQAVWNYWESGNGRNALIVSPTGSGKSIILAEMIKRLCLDSSDIKILVITDTRELISQDYKSIKNHYPECNIGIYSAGLREKSVKPTVICCGIQSMYNKAYDFGRVDVVIIDEAHLVSPKSTTRFQKFFTQLRVSSPHFVVVGLTATPFRLSDGMLNEGDDALFEDIVYVCDMKRLIKEGYLVNVISKGGLAKIDLKGVRVQAGDYNSKDLAYAADSKILVEKAVNEIVEYGKDRKCWLIFTSGIKHSEHVAEELKKHKIDCEIVTGDTPSEERNKIVEKYRNGKLRCLINVGIYTKGLDVPAIDLVALLTSTKSTGRYIQMVGRSMRPSPTTNKANAILLDFGNNCIEHGPIDSIDPVKIHGKDIFGKPPAKPPMRECERCHCIHHARLSVCPGCGFVYPKDEDTEARHGATAYSGPVMSDQIKPYIIDVVDTYVSKHSKPGKIPSVKVEFIDRMDRAYPIWICLDHRNYAAEKARALVQQLGGKSKSVEEALKEYPNWRKVEKIEVRPDGKFTRVTGFVFAKGQSTQQKLEG